MFFFGFLLIPENQKILQSKAADYSEPVQTITRERRASFVGSVVNDWREYQWTTAAPSDVVEGSSTISSYAVDYYGTNFETWVSIYATGGGQSDSKIFDYGWSTQPLNDMTFPITAASGRTLKVIFRYRYTDSTQNPPASNMSGAMRFWITWEEPVNYSQPQTTAIPSDWLSTTTETATYPDFDFSTSTYYDMNNFDTFTQSVKYDLATVFGIADSGADITRMMNYIDSKTQYASAIISFCLLCGCVVEGMKWG